MLLNDMKQMKKCLRTSRVHGLADCLTRPLLESGRHKELAKKVVQLLVFAHHDSADKVVANHGRVPFPKENVPDSLDFDDSKY